MLHRLRGAALGEQREQRVALVAVHGGRTHLDQRMGGERPLDLREHRVGDALAAKVDHGMQGMRLPFQGLALRR